MGGFTSVEKYLINKFLVSSDMGTTKGLFFHMVPLLCQKLMFSTEWRGDMNVTLTALELLADLARLDARFIGMYHYFLLPQAISNAFLFHFFEIRKFIYFVIFNKASPACENQ